MKSSLHAESKLTIQYNNFNALVNFYIMFLHFNYVYNNISYFRNIRYEYIIIKLIYIYKKYWET